MSKTIFITGSTDGIGLATAQELLGAGHQVMIHGRNAEKLQDVEKQLRTIAGETQVETYLADLSDMKDVDDLARAVTDNHSRLDVLINNAGVHGGRGDATGNGLDPRFAVNTISPYLLTQRLLPLLGSSGRVINVSSAALATVDVRALTGPNTLSHADAYAQSKLALTMWSRHMAQAQGVNGPVIIAVNPGSLLGSKMVKQTYGIDGGDIRIGAEILARAALDEEFAAHSGDYYDNDEGSFATPHPDQTDDRKAGEIVRAIEDVIDRLRL